MFEFNPYGCNCGCSDDDTTIFGVFSGNSNFSLIQGALSLLDVDLSTIAIPLTNYLIQTFTVLAYSDPLLNLGTIVGGSGYVDGVYQNVPYTGGTGVGGYGTFTVIGGVVVGVMTTIIGTTEYVIGDILSADPTNLGGTGSGVQVTVAGYQPTPLSYANISGSPDEVKMVMIVPQYDSSLVSYPTQQVIQWRFQGTSTWSNIGAFMFLSGTQNIPGLFSNTNLIGEIEFQNLTNLPIRLKILLGI
jgi:hypothetical protein